jgi:MFS transporter, DHA2 family, multidrug resistance protein
MKEPVTADAPGPRAGRREWIGLLVLALPCVLYAMDLTVLNLAVPALSTALSPTSSELLWIVDIYGFLVAGSLITMGTLGDRIGRRRLLMLGAAAFGVVSVIAAFATTAPMLIAARAVLGVAGATLAPSTLSLIRNMFLDPRQRSVAIGVWITSYSVGGAVGPLVGGVLLAHFWWGSVFLVSVPVMVLLLLLGPVLLPEFRDPAAGRIDLASAGLSLVAVLAAIFGLKKIAEHGVGLLPLTCIAAGVVAGFLFVRRQRTLADPLIDLHLFGSRAFSAALIAYLLATFAAFGSYIFIAQYLQLVLGLTPLQAGLWTLPWMGGFIVGSNLAPLITRRVRPPLLMTGALVMAAVGFGVLAQVDGRSSIAVLVVAMTLSSLGLAPVFTLGTDMIVGAARPEQAGVAAAISESSSELGGALGIAILGSVGIAIYRSGLADKVGERIPPAALEAAQRTLAGAIKVSGDLAADRGAELVAAADAAFMRGLAVTAMICAAVAIATAVVVLVLLGRAGPSSPVAPPASNP